MSRVETMMKNNKKSWVKNGFEAGDEARKGRTAMTTRAFHKLMTFGSDLKFKFHYKLLRCDHEPFGTRRRTDNRSEMGSQSKAEKTKRAKLVEIYLIKLICVSASPFQLFPFVFDLWFFFSLNAFPFLQLINLSRDDKDRDGWRFSSSSFWTYGAGGR